MAQSYRKPLHNKIGWWGWLRAKLRGRLFGALRKLAATDDAKAIQAATMQNLLGRRPSARLPWPDADDAPYPDLGCREQTAATRPAPIMITARFRTGSTLLWNLFRHVPNCTAYYEPFNERRWFDPAVRGSKTDLTHRGVDDYWREYDGLAFLGAHYDERWIDHELLMDADDWNPAMRRYVALLIDHARGRAVLQFNRIDFRLPWFRHHFPDARFVHLYRHPRDQWCSSLVDVAACPRDCTMEQFAPHDQYYLRNWARDLRYHFPFLAEESIGHPYRAFYCIWKLSYLHGRHYADHSIAFEDLTDDPASSLRELFSAVDWPGVDVDSLLGLVEKPRSGRWRQYADEDWFRCHEAACELMMAGWIGSDAAATLAPAR
jgi:hypothetical protein